MYAVTSTINCRCDVAKHLGFFQYSARKKLPLRGRNSDVYGFLVIIMDEFETKVKQLLPAGLQSGKSPFVQPFFMPYADIYKIYINFAFVVSAVCHLISVI